jgi:outer membrane protein OmpA-like peptidoglycan-associated protein
MKTLFPIIAALAVAPPAAAQVGRLARVEFSPGSAAIAEQRLDDVVAWAAENPDGLIVLDGHAGHREDVRLSLDRAKAVRDRLVKAGVDPDQIVIAVFGNAAERSVVVWGERGQVVNQR